MFTSTQRRHTLFFLLLAVGVAGPARGQTLELEFTYFQAPSGAVAYRAGVEVCRVTTVTSLGGNRYAFACPDVTVQPGVNKFTMTAITGGSESPASNRYGITPSGAGVSCTGNICFGRIRGKVGR